MEEIEDDRLLRIAEKRLIHNEVIMSADEVYQAAGILKEELRNYYDVEIE